MEELTITEGGRGEVKGCRSTGEMWGGGERGEGIAEGSEMGRGRSDEWDRRGVEGGGARGVGKKKEGRESKSERKGGTGTKSAWGEEGGERWRVG